MYWSTLVGLLENEVGIQVINLMEQVMNDHSSMGNPYIVIIVNAKVVHWHVFDKMAIIQLSTICLSNIVFRLYYGTCNSINLSHWVHV